MWMFGRPCQLLGRQEPARGKACGGPAASLVSSTYFAALAHALVGKEYRQLGSAEDVAGGAAENHLSKSALSIGTLDQQVGALGLGLGEDGLARPAAARLHRLIACCNAVGFEMGYRVLGARARHDMTLDAEQRHALGLAQDRHGHQDHARR